jgi:hypothetical protein
MNLSGIRVKELRHGLQGQDLQECQEFVAGEKHFCKRASSRTEPQGWDFETLQGLVSNGQAEDM